jgi:hypothetical protein
MTESDWLTSIDPQGMLSFLAANGRGSGRKFRLFAVSCCRRVTECLTEETRTLVEVAEQVAEGMVDDRERKKLRAEAMRAHWRPDQSTAHARGPAKAAVFWALAKRPSEAAIHAAHYAVVPAGRFAARRGEWPVISDSQARMAHWDAMMFQEGCVQAALLRDIFGLLPFRLPPPLDLAVLGWNDGCVERLATSMYLEGDFSAQRMGVLADALEEAGVSDPALLEHLRGPAGHVRGCWVVDLLTGKE